MVKMNGDTKKTFLLIVKDKYFVWRLEEFISSEICFIYELARIIAEINIRLNVENEIKFENVNGNEIYVRFSKLIGNEQEGWK